MTIVGLKKITLYAPMKEKTGILDDLQGLGCLHIIPLKKQENILDHRSLFSDTREALKHLQTTPTKLKTQREIKPFDPAEIERKTLQNKREIENLTLESDALKKRIEDLNPWGCFVLPDPKEMGDQKFWFYRIPHNAIKKIENRELCLQKVNQDHQYCYVVVIARDKPELPENDVQVDPEPLAQLKKRLEQIDMRLEDLEIERIQLTRSLGHFEKNLYRLEDQNQLKSVFDQTFDQNPLFVLQGWIPISHVENVLKYAKEKKIAAVIERPSPQETPPTLLVNRPVGRSGEDLLSFYMTPSYWLWDPSFALFFSFAIFFAMIFSDAGYALILGTILAIFWKKMGLTPSKKRFRSLLVALTLFSVVWGVLVGSYFGLSPQPSSMMGRLKVIDMQNYSVMMALVIAVGAIHIMIANLALAWSLRKSTKAFAPIGWVFALFGAALAFFSGHVLSKQVILKTVGFWVIGLGLALVLLFTSAEKNLGKRILSGLTGLARVTGIFGDVLSYLRLFALGLASASLASVFNHLATQVYLASPTFKIIFVLLIILIGHGINFMLSMMSGFIHGLRLNFIEFFNWSLPEEGIPFKAFVKREGPTWNR